MFAHQRNSISVSYYSNLVKELLKFSCPDESWNLPPQEVDTLKERHRQDAPTALNDDIQATVLMMMMMMMMMMIIIIIIIIIILLIIISFKEMASN